MSIPEFIIIVIAVLILWFIFPKIGKFVGGLIGSVIGTSDVIRRFYTKLQRRSEMDTWKRDKRSFH